MVAIYDEVICLRATAYSRLITKIIQKGLSNADKSIITLFPSIEFIYQMEMIYIDINNINLTISLILFNLIYIFNKIFSGV